MATKKMKKNDYYYSCNLCDFNTCKKTNYELHLQTIKHTRNISVIFGNTEATEKILTCDKCNKIYQNRTGLWRHKNKCCYKKNNTLSNDICSNTINDYKDKEIIIMLIKENAEVKNMIMEQQNIMMKVLENGTHNTTNNTNNSHNKTFNLNFFLNETCKDAMNIMDFVESINLQLSDLENVGKLGYVDGISNIIVKNLNDLDVTERPIHCTDKKRETLYIKDENKWEKEDEEKNKIKKVIKHVANKNIRLLQKFKEVHPDCSKSTSKYSDQYDKIIVEAMGGSGDNDLEKEEKIIHKISKNVTIDKDFAIQ
jgi:uncharacterized C2H2 Zn-finger protein